MPGITAASTLAKLGRRLTRPELQYRAQLRAANPDWNKAGAVSAGRPVGKTAAKASTGKSTAMGLKARAAKGAA